MLEHMTLDELLDDMPPAERAAMEYEAYLIAHPPAVEFGATETHAASRENACSLSANDISD